MSTNQITGTITTGVTLTSALYDNPVTVTSTGNVSGSAYGIYAATDWTIDNAGSISGGSGIYLKDGGSVTNETGGMISGGSEGVDIAGAAGTVDNAGTITGGVFLEYGGSVSNAANGSISGGVTVETATGAVDNSGAITGNGFAGAFLLYGGSVTNEAGGSISGGRYGVNILGAGGTVDNSGTIIGMSRDGVFLGYGSVTNAAGGSISGGYNGIDISGAPGAVENSGTITGTSDTGVYLEDGGSVTNATGGSISGYETGVRFYGAAATLENAGTITGGTDSVHLGATGTNRLIVDAGAVFSGDVVANATAANTLELASGSSVGTISGLGTHYTGFQTVTIDSGATWTVGGTEAGFNSAMIQGFGVHDTLDITDLTFNGSDSVTLNGSDLLTVENSTGVVLETIQLTGIFAGDYFHLAADSGTGTLITEDTTPCYCRGARIRTPKGEVAVEHLKIGDRVTTASGETLPIKWIGRRSYRDWLAVGNPDVQPILFRAGSIADHIPTRDLYVSPEHAMFLDGVLIPAQHLVNGVSILKMSGMEEVEYFHFEFDRHVVIYAEGAAAESFVDDDSRMLFHNADEYRRLYPDESRGRFTAFCAPRVESGHALETIHHRLMARATRLLPDGTATPAAVQQGYLDRATRTLVEGWAFAEGGPAKLAILVNGAIIGQTLADGYRADLAKAGVGDGHCSFRFDLPHGLSPDLSHRIEVRRESDWSPIIGGCVTLEPEAPYSAISMTRMSRSAVSGPSTASASR